MIYGWVGQMGSGKTLSMTRMAYFYHKMGWSIYSNYEVSFPHTLITRDFLENIVKENTLMEGDKNLFILDEIDIYVDSRRSMSTSNILISYFLKQVRKKSAKVFWAAQMESAVDKRLRVLTKTITLCDSRKYTIKTDDYEKTIVMIDQDITVRNNNGIVRKSNTFCANPFFNKYDTKTLITLD